MKLYFWILAMLLSAAVRLAAAQEPAGRVQSPASQRPPETVKAQTYSPELIRAGEGRFVAECGFCHGRDAGGGETGPDLTRSMLVAEDFRGDKIGPLVRSGRVEKGMPSFSLNVEDTDAIVAFIHDQKTKMEAVGGGRRGVDPGDLDTGNVEAGRSYFNGAGNCSTCHSAAGDLAGIGTRLQGLPLLQRMLYPTGAKAKVTVTLPSGNTVSGSMASRDEFTITLTDSSGERASWPIGDVKFTIDDPLAAHFEQLGKYTDHDMHNVYAYLQSLR
jgi:cytochrome c oxidase cbb3-type subunit III